MISSDKETQAKEMQRLYLKEWRRRNKDKVRIYNQSYWLRKVEQRKEEDNDTVSENR